MTLSSCFLGKSGKMRFSDIKKACQSYKQTFTSCLGTNGCPSGNWERRLTNLHFSLQPRRPYSKFPGTWLKKTVLHPMSQQKSFPVSQLDLYFFPAWAPVVVLVGTGKTDSWICVFLSNQGGPIKCSKLTRHRKNSSASYDQVLQSTNTVLLYSHFFPNHRLSDFIPSRYGGEGGVGWLFHFDMPKSQTNTYEFYLFSKTILQTLYSADYKIHFC